MNVHAAVRNCLERVIDPAYHTNGAAGIARRGFRNEEPPAKVAHLMKLYGKPSYYELEKALLQLSEPMDRSMPIEVMLKGIEEVQMFLLANEE